ncbi:MAG: DNA translocase FtsK, partial [Candidatus Omnitrophica bacterium]|nr:DNA translocase FtsK [Candidatus Omnitrophota bacterium]
MKKERINEMWGVLFLLLGFYIFGSILFFHPEDLAFYSSHPNFPVKNVTGIIGAYLAFGLKLSFGDSAVWIPGLFLLWAFCFFTQRVPVRKTFKFIGLAIALVSTCVLESAALDPDLRFEHGGAVGYLAATHLLKYFGHLGSYILASACLLLSLLLATDFLLYPMVKAVAEKIHEIAGSIASFVWGIRSFVATLFTRKRSSKEDIKKQAIKEISKSKSEKEKLKVPSEISAFDPRISLKVKHYSPESEAAESEAEQNVKPLVPHMLKIKKEPAAKPDYEAAPIPREMLTSKSRDSVPEIHEGVVGSKTVFVDYKFPSIDILKRPEKTEIFAENLQENSKILEETLADFGIEVKVVEVEQGPVITRYELLPAPGVKVNSIAALSDDIALALKAASVRLIIPIPGKSAVGVEIPNSVASKVYFRELVDVHLLKAKKQILPLVLGKDTSGKPLIADLAGMPHVLIAGTTGSGKTVCVNSIILGLLYTNSPEDLKFVMVDPKMVELAVYNKIPHMLSPVVTDVRKAAHTLNWVVSEMENRYRLLAKVGVRNIQSFNARPVSPEAAAEMGKAEGSENVIPVKLPYIVVIIDELADLMMVAQDKVEGAIARLAQLSRAVGIHLILATQRPSVDVITGVIKANFPARISFKVAAKVDSRTVLDCMGADKLLGKGDLLFLQPGHEKPTRGQGCFVTDDEINSVVEFVSSQAKPEYHPEIAQVQSGKISPADEEKDELFEEAVNVVFQTGQASTSNLQRRLGLGYTRAARIIDQMEASGIIGPTQGAKPREILVSRDSV